MRPTDSTEILVVGGGIGGLAAALALARAGRRVRVLEKAAEFGEIGYGIQLGPNAYRILQALDIARDIEPQAVFPDALIIMDALTGAELTRLDLGAWFRARYGFPYIVIHRRDIHGALLEACRRRGDIALETSKGLEHFEEREGRVQVTCEDGTEYEGAALVGCDGIWSPVRAQIVGDGPARITGHVAYRGVVPVEEVADRSHLDSVILYVGHNMHLVQYRLRGGTVMNNVAVIESNRFHRGEREFGGPEELEEIFAQAAPEVRELLRYVSRERNWVLHDRDPVPNWTRGNATLLGDAAHPTLQYLAQGACMALEDAAVLSAKVAAHGEAFNAAFLAYQEARYLRTARVQITARFFGAVCHAGRAERDLRNHLFAQRTPETHTEVDWIYRGVEL